MRTQSLRLWCLRSARDGYSFRAFERNGRRSCQQRRLRRAFGERPDRHSTAGVSGDPETQSRRRWVDKAVPLVRALSTVSLLVNAVLGCTAAHGRRLHERNGRSPQSAAFSRAAAGKCAAVLFMIRRPRPGRSTLRDCSLPIPAINRPAGWREGVNHQAVGLHLPRHIITSLIVGDLRQQHL